MVPKWQKNEGDSSNFNDGKFAEANDRVVHTIFNPSVIPVVKIALNELEEMGIGKFDIINEI